MPLSELLNGNAFGQVENPSGAVYDIPGFGIPGTVEGPNGENLMPWANTTFKLDVAQPFENWLSPPNGGSIREPDPPRQP